MGGTNGNDMGKTTQHKNQWKGLTAMTQGYNTKSIGRINGNETTQHKNQSTGLMAMTWSDINQRIRSAIKNK